MAAPYGNGSELDDFDDLPISPMAEAKFLKRPRALRHPYENDGAELGDFNDLTVWTIAEARFFREPVLANSQVFGKISVVIRKRTKVLSPLQQTEVSNAPEVPQRNPGLLALPRELRDEIYRHLLCNTYRIRTPPVRFTAEGGFDCKNADYNWAFSAPVHPRFQPPPPTQSFQHRDPIRATDTIAPWCPGAPGYDMISSFEKTAREMGNDERLVYRWGFAQPSNHLPVLLVSKATYEEAVLLLYNHSTFFFSVNQPREFLLNAHTVERMKKVWIDVDLLRAFMRDYSTRDSASTLESCRRLVCRFGGNKIERTSCVINFKRGEDSAFLRLPSFIQALQALVGFRTVVIRLTTAYEEWWPDEFFRPEVYPEMMQHMHDWDVSNLILLDDNLKHHLGPNTAKYGRQGSYCLFYHPRVHQTGSHPPRPLQDGIDDLADPPDLVTKSPKTVSYLPRLY